MYQKRFLCWNLSFLALSIAAALVAVFPEYAGLANQPPKLPESAVRHQDRVARADVDKIHIERPVVSISELAIESAESERSEICGSRSADNADTSQGARSEDIVSTRIVCRVEVSPRTKEFARKFKSKNLLEGAPASKAKTHVAKKTNVVVDDGKVVDVPVSPREKYTPPAALTYLKDFQHREGHWSATTHWPKVRQGAFSFDKETACDTEYGWESDNMANTALALLCYVSAGYDHTMGPFKAEVRKGLLYLRRNQDQEGRFSTNPRHHAMALMAFAETYGLSGASVLRPGCDKAIDALVKMQNADGGFGSDGVSNVVDTGYVVLALKSALMAGLEFDKAPLKTAHAYVDSMRDQNVVHYSANRTFAPHYGNGLDTELPMCEAIWVLTGLMSREITIRNEAAKAIAARLMEDQNLPRWEANNVDCQYYFFASKAMLQLGGKRWKTWHKATNVTLLNSQRGYTEMDKDNEWTSETELFEFGSWDPVGVNGPRYGRVFTTAMCCLTLDVYSRYYSSAEDVVEHHERDENPRADNAGLTQEDARIIEDANDDVTEDMTDSSNEDLAPNPTD
ncbi:MAG: prenyltransferase/squalene oxidase repeat-containing protein [Planctomycetota bacterium]|jgi:hypothetical protein